MLICGVCFEDGASEICLMLAELAKPGRENLPKPRDAAGGPC